jgi:uncharacterized protein DUF6291
MHSALWIGGVEMAKDKKSFVLYHSFYDVIKDMSDQDAGLLLKAVFEYHINNLEIELPPVLKMAFQFIKSQLDRDRVKYQATCEKRATAGSKGGKQKQANVANASKSSKSKQNIANVANLADNDDVDDDVDDDDIKKSKPKEKSSFVFADFFPDNLNTPEFVTAWLEWEKHRREIKKKLTPSTVKKQLEKLAGLSQVHAIATIEKSIESGWTGLFPDKATPSQPEQSNSELEMLKRAARR